MDLTALLTPIRRQPEYQALLDRLRAGKPAGSERLPKASRPPVLAALAEELGRPLLVLVPREDRLLTLSEELNAWAPAIEAAAFPEPNPLFYELAPWGPRARRQRAAVLARLTAGRLPGGPADSVEMPALILCSARAAMARTLSVRDFLANSRWLAPGAQRSLEALLRHLVDTGYQAATVVAEPGQFSRRGGILDVWPPAEDLPVRVEFFGDEVDSLRTFDPSTQRSGNPVDGLRLSPAREALPKAFHDEWRPLLPAEALESQPGDPAEPLLEFFLPWMNPRPASLLDFLPDAARVLIEDQMAFEAAVDEFEEQAVAFRRDQETTGRLPSEAPLAYLTLPELRERLTARSAVDLGMATDPADDRPRLGDRFRAGPRFGGQLQPLLTHLASRQMAHEATVVVSRQAARLAELWQEEAADSAPREAVPGSLVPGEVVFIQGALAEGWTFQPQGAGPLHLLTDAEIFGWARPQPRRPHRRRAAAPESSYADLEPESLVVHVDYGLGRFKGLVERTLSGLAREYLLVEYAAGGQVYVPVHQADRLTRYVGVDGSEPPLSRLGTAEWDRVRRQAQESVEEFARELLSLYARRASVEGHAYSPDTAWQRELEASFSYIETEDQLRAIEAVKRDMEEPRPMDRLVCGDVGYGKTEVALRAAFKAVMDNRQVAMLVPTTILAQQHFNTFRDRLAAYPVGIEMLSRFRSKAEADEIVGRMQTGEIDIVIGTHRLLQPDVEFKNLGLLIIDEEQRFGVTHKEHLKQMRTQVDVLTMTATPIPRTLYMALTGVRDISTIDTPPEERLPIITQVGHYDPRLVRQAILREVDRGGQVFFVHNRVQTIDRMRERVVKLVPEATIAVAHGQMAERSLSQVMERFSSGEIDVLVSTSIIESGLDIPNANTLIVDQAETFGLAQLYQLRGRVGRGPLRGYAYFLRRPQSRASEEALQRLAVIAENSQLGAGYSIAMRDLEIRGAGDILGTRQHGHIAAVGFHLYTRLLGSAVRRLRRAGEEGLPATTPLPPITSALDVAVELPLPSVLPTDYVEDRTLRLQLYRRMAEVRSLPAVTELEEELTDRFGPPPEEVANLLYQLKIKVLAAAARVQTVTTENGQILLELEATDQQDEPAVSVDLGPDVRQSRRGLWLYRNQGVDWTVRLEQVLTDLSKARGPAPRPTREAGTA